MTHTLDPGSFGFGLLVGFIFGAAYGLVSGYFCHAIGTWRPVSKNNSNHRS